MAPDEKTKTGARSAAAKTAATDAKPLDNDSDPKVPLVGDKPLAETTPVGPPNPEPVGGEAAPRNEAGAISVDPVELQKAGQSPADLEVPGLGAFGGPQIVKQNPEIPSMHQVEGALTKNYGAPDVAVEITDGDGRVIEHALGVSDRATIQQRAVASLSAHPAMATEGHWSNPNLQDMTEEEREADQKAYADRFGK